MSAYTQFQPDIASGLPPLHSVMHDVQVLLESVGYLGIILVDLEPLEDVEHEFGHVAYNELLKELAGELQTLRHESLGAGDLICTMQTYAEQFVIFLEGPGRDDQFFPLRLESVVDRVWSMFSPKVSALVRPYGLRVSPRIGYSLVLSNVMVQPERLVYRGLQEARRMAYDHHRRLSARAREELRNVLVRNQLRMMFQPVVEVTSSRICGYEALVRGPSGTPFVMPAELFRLAANARLTGELMRACFEQTFANLEGFPEDSSLFLNITPDLIHDKRFRARMLEADSNDSLSPAQIVLELNEGVAVRNYDFVAKSLEDIRKAGAKLAIDDLGVGYSNLNHLLRLNPEFLKLDISLISDIHIDKAKAALVKSLIEVAKEVGATIVAEGIEKSEEREVLLDLGVPLAQGYYFAHPEEGFAPKIEF